MERTLSVFIISLGISFTSSISTIHHDKPESVSISTIKGTTTDGSMSSPVLVLANVTLTSSERKKRLLPYQNFYFNQPFNRPHQAGVSAQQYKDYEDARVNKKPEYEPAGARPKDVLYRPSQKFTPFLESNALPGHFRPMAASNNNNPQKIQYTYLTAQPAKGHLSTDFSAIYDKLSQLKLRQQDVHNKTPYGHRLVPHHRFRERPQKLQEYRPSIFDSPTRYKINPSKTTIETFTATNIDIPDRTEEERYKNQPTRYYQIPTPTKEQFSTPIQQTSYRENNEPFIHHQIAIEVPQSSLPLTFSPNLVRKPSNGKERPGKPYIFIQQDKPDTKQQQVLILRKPKPAVVVDEHYLAEKYVPHGPSKYHYQHRPLFTPQEPQYSQAPVYESNYDIPYQVTPAPIELNQEEYQPFAISSSFNQLEYGAKLAAEPQKMEYMEQKVKYEQLDYEPQKVEYEQQKKEYEPVLISSTPQYEDDNKYYQYQTVTPGPTASVTPISAQNPIILKQKLVPQHQELPKLQGAVVYRVTQQPKLENTGGASNPLSEILKQLQESNTLPQTLTPDNIDNSIRTLVKILNALRDRQKQQKPVPVQDNYDYENEAGVELGVDLFDTPDGGTPGKPGIDYPALSTIPKTSFNCKTQRYKGFFGDPDTNCQVWHYCDLNGGQASFLCPNGTIFSQVALTCDWWYNVKCSSTAQLYVLNERLYKYIIPLSPKFPEDYSGPLVDKYLALKFQEMEEKLRKQKKGKGNVDSKESDEDNENSDSEDADEDDDSTENESESKDETGRPTNKEQIDLEEVTTTSLEE